MTPTSSVAVRVETATVRLLEVAGMVNDVTVGGVVSDSVIASEALRGTETFPAASLANAYRVFTPWFENLYDAGTDVAQAGLSA